QPRRALRARARAARERRDTRRLAGARPGIPHERAAALARRLSRGRPLRAALALRRGRRVRRTARRAVARRLVQERAEQRVVAPDHALTRERVAGTLVGGAAEPWQGRWVGGPGCEHAGGLGRIPRRHELARRA